jgi:alpha-tubulin suppressor-like RCC1 family protein
MPSSSRRRSKLRFYLFYVFAAIVSILLSTLVLPPAALATSTAVIDVGFNNYGYLGNGSTSDVSSPTSVSGLSGITQISAGFAGDGILALHSDQTVTAWGKNDQGELGDGSTSYRETSPVTTTGLSSIIQVSDGSNGFGEALDSSGNVYSWGDNNSSYAELGRTTGGSNDPTPAQVTAVTGNIKQLATGFGHTLALTTGGTLWVWGYNNSGQLGDSTKTANTYAPFALSSGILSSIVQVSAGYNDSYALDSSGNVWAWGANFTTTPTKILGPAVSSGPRILNVAGGYNHGLAVDSGGNAWAWGLNQYGQLGNGTTGSSYVSPFKLSSFGTVASVWASTYESFAITTSGEVYGWGANWWGQIGDGTTTERHSPQHDTGLSGIGSMASNGFASFWIPTGTTPMAQPSWWSGTCDVGNNSGSYPLYSTATNTITSYDGVVACGPGNTSYWTDFGSGGSSQNEWQCVELVKRYMYVEYGVPPYGANGDQIVSSYSGSIMTKVTNTGSNLPVAGDVISFNAVSPYDLSAGHTAIVTAVNVSGGSGTLTIMEQNTGHADGIGSVPVSSGGVSTTTVNGWLHH